MKDWLSYRLSDLLLFSPRTYYRMFELYHQEIWPAQLVALTLALAILVLMRRDDEWRGRVIAGLLAACWLWVAVMFHVRRYATINWAARYFAVLFVAQAALLVWNGVVRRRLTFRRQSEASALLVPGLLLIAIAIPPLVGRVTGRTWSQVELVGLTPDATAIATLGILLVSSPRAPRTLMVVPLCWCVIGGATSWALGSAEAWVPIVAAAGTLAATVWPRRTPSAVASTDVPNERRCYPEE
jgi:hypothetical protein